VGYASRSAPPALRSVVRSLWYHESAPTRRYERILPQPVAHLVVNLSDPYRLLSRGGEWVGDPFRAAFVSGLQPEYLVIENPDWLWQCGAELEPAGLTALVTTPPAELSARVRNADNLIAGSAGWRDALRAADHDAERTLDVLTELLEAALRPGITIDPIVTEGLARLDADPDLPIARLASDLGLSNAQLIRRFRDGVGVTPKTYADLARFSHFLNAIPFDAVPTWSELVATTGYHDQPHFIRSFKRYTGYTPSRYLAGVREFGAEFPSFVPMDEFPTIATPPGATTVG
jgi:AraC-like DNA-binding protein